MRKRVKKLLHNDEKCVTIKALYVNLLLGGIRIMATFYASKTGEVSAREKEHSALVRELAGECYAAKNIPRTISNIVEIGRAHV